MKLMGTTIIITRDIRCSRYDHVIGMATIINNYKNKKKIVPFANQRLSECEFKITESC